jgi:DNA-binding NtrC family response regulator
MDLLIVEDDADFRDTLRQWMTRRGHHVADTGLGADAVQLLATRRFDVAIVDLHLPDRSGLDLLADLQREAPETEVLLLTGSATVETAVEAMKRGANDYLTKPFPLAALEERCRKAAEHGRLRQQAEQWKAIARRQLSSDEIVGDSDAMTEVRRLIERVAPTDKPVLILGETGVGKELAARAVQRASRRADQPFVVVNCAALPEQLIESELFGHEKGAFTGATEAKPGLFEVADGGTFFIDEIGELPLSLQPKLLRVLEDGSLRRVGSARERRVDVRLIAATNRDLGQDVQAHRFREDLWYRINVFPMVIPPLRDRAGDVARLLHHFLPAGWRIEPAAQAALERYPWPGNVRQLRNVLDRATILATGSVVTADDLPSELMATSPRAIPPMASSVTAAADDTLETWERGHVEKILQACGGNKSEAARTLGIHRRKLYRLLERLGIEMS